MSAEFPASSLLLYFNYTFSYFARFLLRCSLFSQNIFANLRIIADFLLYLQRKFILVYKQTQQKTKIMRQKKMIIAALAAMLLAAGDKEKSNAMTIGILRQQW